MTRRERLKYISELVMDQGEISNDQLAKALDVSLMTIHRDLDELERQGIVRKIRNGATARPSSSFESNYQYRLSCAQSEKARLCEHVAKSIVAGDILFIDEATTLLPIVPFLKEIGDLTVITNFMLLQRELVNVQSVKLIGLGGEYLHSFDSMSGPICAHAVTQFQATKYLTSSTAIDGSNVYHPDIAISVVKRAMLKAADHSTLVFDHSKVGRRALNVVAKLEDFDKVVSDRQLPKGFELTPNAASKLTVLASS